MFLSLFPRLMLLQLVVVKDQRCFYYYYFQSVTDQYFINYIKNTLLENFLLKKIHKNTFLKKFLLKETF